LFAKSGIIRLSKTNIEFKTKIVDFNLIDCVRISPKIGYYVIEVVYTIPDVAPLDDDKRYMGIDLGINNLATLTSNAKDFEPIIINGKPLKSRNQFYNKKLAKKTSVLEKRNKKKTSRSTRKLTLKRKNKIDNYMHKASKKIVEICINNNINTIAIGKNEQWKQDVNMAAKNNQNFVNIPHSRFIEMISYKCEKVGINVKLQEESYTSKASFLNLDEIPKYKKDNSEKYTFSGYRKHRGLYKIKKEKTTINADINGSLNIIRKAFPIAFCNGIQDIGVCPTVIKL
jgi:putative transposase